MINEEALRIYLFREFRDVLRVDIRKLGSGVQGSGFLVEVRTKEGLKTYVVKTLVPEGFGHDYPSDRASVFLLDLDEYKNLPNHVEALDVLAGVALEVGQRPNLVEADHEHVFRCEFAGFLMIADGGRGGNRTVAHRSPGRCGR